MSRNDRLARIAELREAYNEAVAALEKVRHGIELYECGRSGVVTSIYRSSRSLGVAAIALSDSLPLPRRRRCKKCKELREIGNFAPDSKWCNSCAEQNHREFLLELLHERLEEFEAKGKKAEAGILRQRISELTTP